MTYTTYGTATSSATLRGRIAARLTEARQGWGKWRVYQRTLDELSSLSDRDLNDLGLNRSMVRTVAMQAAYGA